MVFRFDGTLDTYEIWLNDVSVHDETGVTGTINNTGNEWNIGRGPNNIAFTEFGMDNLQIFDSAVSTADIENGKLNCQIPD
jgi:hypothetical protein